MELVTNEWLPVDQGDDGPGGVDGHQGIVEGITAQLCGGMYFPQRAADDGAEVDGSCPVGNNGHLFGRDWRGRTGTGEAIVEDDLKIRSSC